MLKNKLIGYLLNLPYDVFLETYQGKEKNRDTMLLYYNIRKEVIFDGWVRSVDSYEDSIYLISDDKAYLSDIVRFEFLDLYNYYLEIGKDLYNCFLEIGKAPVFIQKNIDDIVKNIVNDVFDRFDTYRYSETYNFEKDIFATRTIVSECLRQYFDKISILTKFANIINQKEG